MRLVSLLICVLAAQLAFGQLAGVITDERTQKPVEAAEVFIHGRSVSTITDQEGKFQLEGISPGFADLVLYKKGYTLFKSSIRIDPDKRYEVNLSLQPAPKQSGSPAPPEETSLFKEALLGVNDLNLVNASALSIVQRKSIKSLMASEPLHIINKRLGYKIRYYLDQAVWSGRQYEVQGYFTFETISASGTKEIIALAQRRVSAYSGSLRHLLKSLVSGTTKEEGFELTPAISTKPSISNYHTLILTSPTSVTYQGVTSQLTTSGSLQASADGILLIPQHLAVSGPMADKSSAFMLPQDYFPVVPGADDFMQYYEKIYVHTDKPYYYPGEPLWFKGYINYYKPALRDSLSRVAYVEIIGPEKKLIASKTLRIDSGLFNGEFALPDSLAPGNYFLRAYTQLARNYGDEALFMKSIPVINLTARVDPQQGANITSGDPRVSITADKPLYQTREKITLTIKLTPETKAADAHVSLVVTDATQVVTIPTSRTMLNEFPVEHGRILPNTNLIYPAELGFGYKGQFFNDQGKPAKTNLTIIQHNPRNVLFAETDNNGYFSQAGLQFYDTATFSYKSEKAKNAPFGKVVVLPRQPAPIVELPEPTMLMVQNTEELQRLISEYEVPKDTKLLDEVTVSASRIEQEVKPIRMYGAGDFSIPENKVKTGYPNLLYTLVGTPGLYVVPGEGIIKFTRAMTQSIFNETGPLVVLNDVPLSGDAGQILSMIDPNNVSSIEITRRLKSIFGSQGGSGVISVYTKSGLVGTSTRVTPNFQKIRLMGFARPRKFQSPDYSKTSTDTSKPDYRATLYWNPEIHVTANAVTLTFFSSDLPGNYRIEAEGILSNGEPVRVVQLIQVEER